MPKHKLYNYLILAIALASTLGSLYFSEIKHFIPCNLCWYQRIVMYPLLAIVPVGILLRDRRLPYYVLSLASIGTLIGVYHCLLQYGIVKESVTVCGVAASCSSQYINYFGFITIPLLSLGSFVAIAVLSYLSIRQIKSVEPEIN